MYILLFILGMSPGGMWLEAIESAEWAAEYDYALEAQFSRVESSGLLPDPFVQFSLAGSPIETRNGPIANTIAINQRIPWPGLLSAYKEEAAANFNLMQASVNSMLLKKRTEIAISWAKVYSHQEKLFVFKEKALLLNSLLSSVSSNSTSSSISQSELVNLRVLTELANQKPTSELRLLEAAKVELQVQTGFNLSTNLELPDPDWFLEATNNVNSNSPELEIARAELLRKKVELDTSETRVYPDFLIGLSYSFIEEPTESMSAIDPGKDSWMLSLGMNLPLGYSGTNYRVHTAELEVLQGEYHLEQLEQEILSDLLLQEALISNAYEELTVLNNLLPLSSSALEAASAAWVSGLGSYSAFNTALQNHLDIQLLIIDKEALLVTSTAKWLELAGAVTNEGEFL